MIHRAVDDLQRRQRQERAALLLLLLPLGLIVGALRWNAHSDIDAVERLRLDGQARAVQQIIGQQLQAAYGALAGIRDEFYIWPADSVASGVSRSLKGLTDAIPGLALAALVDGSGRVVAASRLTLIGAELPFAVAAGNDPAALQVRPPMRDEYGNNVIELVLPLNPQDGAGALVATLDSDYFRVALRSVIYATDMRGSIVHSGGRVLMFEPPRPGDEGADAALPGSYFVRHRDSGRDSSLFSGRLALLGDLRLVALRTLEPDGVPMDAPLVVTLSRDLDAVFSGWRQQTAINAGLYLSLAFGLLASLRLLHARQRTLLALQQQSSVREREEARRLELALRGADLALWDVDPRSGRGSVNARWSEMLGYAAGEIGVDEADWRARIHPDDRAAVGAAQKAHLDGDSPVYEAVYRMRHRDDSWVWILDRGKVLERDADGTAVRMVGTHLDISERMQAEQALRRSEQSLATTLHSIGDAVIATDERGRITRLNATAERLTGWAAAEAVGMPLAAVFRIFSPKGGAPIQDPVQQVLMRGEVVGLANDTLLLRRDGGELQIADSAAPIRGADGRVAGVVLVFSDVSGRYRDQQALRDRERLLSTIADAMPGPVSRVDRDGRYVFANAAYERWFGMPAADVIGRTQRDVLGPRRYAAVEDHVRRVFAGETVHYEQTLRTARGERLHAMVTLVPDRDADGSVCGHFTIVFDITERKQAEDALRDSEQRLRELLEHLQIGVVIHDADGAVLDANPAACRIIGLSAEQMRRAEPRAPGWVVIDEDGCELALEQWPSRRVKATARPALQRVVGVREPGGRTAWVLADAFPVLRSNGSIEQIVVTLSDITERRTLEQQLREAQKMESIGTLAGGIAHDFNNILAAILGNVGLARDDVGPSHPVQRSLEQIQTAAQRARSLVQQILTFSRREPGVLTAQPLRPVVEETLGLLRATLPASVNLLDELPPATRPVLAIRTDATQLQQVLMNLATNAWYALPERGGSIAIGFEGLTADVAAALNEPGLTAGSVAHLWVRDSGHGIDAAALPRIFDPFFTTKPVGQGTGLGLAVVHGIVRAHQGAISVDSRLGVGTTFHLYLPSVAAPPVQAPSPAVVAGSAGRGQRVLYVDDDDVMALMAERLLERGGYAVVTRPGAAEAMALLQGDPAAFDLVVTDYNMPGQSGIDLARLIRALRPDLPVVLISGLVSETLREQARAAGARDVLQKENSFDELVAAVGRVLAGGSASGS